MQPSCHLVKVAVDTLVMSLLFSHLLHHGPALQQFACWCETSGTELSISESKDQYSWISSADCRGPQTPGHHWGDPGDQRIYLLRKVNSLSVSKYSLLTFYYTFIHRLSHLTSMKMCSIWLCFLGSLSAPCHLGMTIWWVWDSSIHHCCHALKSLVGRSSSRLIPLDTLLGRDTLRMCWIALRALWGRISLLRILKCLSLRFLFHLECPPGVKGQRQNHHCLVSNHHSMQPCVSVSCA